MSTEPKALKLPRELWLDILGKRELDYFDLKRCMRVCKALNRLVKDSSLDSILFRKRASPPIVKGTKVEIHPGLEGNLTLIYGGERHALTFNFKTRAEHNLYQYPAVDKFATSPASQAVHVQLVYGDFNVKNDTGVTVKDLLLADAKMWNKRVNEEYGFGGEQGSWKKLRNITWARNSWIGWSAPQVTPFGGLLLRTSGLEA